MVEHIVLVGGGIIGVCTAYYLSKDDRFGKGLVTVTIVEANEIASGASGKAGGFLALDWHGPATTPLAQLSYELHQQLAQELDGENRYGYRKLRSLNASIRVSEPQLHDQVLVDPILPQLRALPSALSAAHTEWLKSPRLESLELISEEKTTSQIHPRLFTHALFEEACALGVKHLKGRPSTWDRDSKILKVDTPEGSRDLAADTLIVTAGPWSGRVAEQLLGLDIPMSYLPGHSILIRPSEPLPAHALFARVHAPDVTQTPEFFVRPDGDVWIGGENRGAELPDGTANVELNSAAINKLIKASAAVSKFLADGTVVNKQLCYRPVTPHTVPYVGFLRRGTTKALIAAGHGPWGIVLAPGTGKVMAELILDGVARSAVISQLDPSRHVKSLPV